MTNQHPMSWWTEARVDELKARWGRNETYGEIARAMGATSRNAVIGKAHRLALFRSAGDATAAKRGNRAPRTPRIRVRKIISRMNGQRQQMSDEEPPIGFTNPVTLIALTATHCRWPGDIMGANTLYCGNACIPGQPYCLTHYRLGHIKPQRAQP